ncbi:MAG: alpha/beta hydrolase [Bacteroidia bacterium]|nr:alpha/beta hydrolase [Bacteroidia bacterium]
MSTYTSITKYISYQNKKIYCHIIGSGKPVVFIHGFGEDGEVWKNQIEFLKEKFLLIIPDIPGSGRSEMIDDMSIEGMAEVIKYILDSEKLISKEHSGTITIIAHSMGGYITLAFAEKYLNYLNSFGLLHSTAYADNEEKKDARRKGIEFIKEHGAFEFLRTTTPNLFSQKTKETNAQMVDEFIGSLSNFSPDALVSYYNAMIQRPDRTDLLKKATIPVLFIIGEHDNAVPFQDSLQQCYLPEISYIHILSQSGHLGMLEEADKTNNALENFLLDT